VVHVAGYEVPAQVEKAREQIGYLAQQFGLYGDLSVEENIEFFGEVFDIPQDEIKQRAAELLNFAGLGDFTDRPAATLSGGMQKKLGLASALIHRPKVLLLDEPTGGVDPVARQEFWHLLITLLRSGSAVLVSTPYMDEAMRFNRVIFMNHGHVLTQGAPRDLMKRLEGRILVLDTDDQTLARLIAEEDPEVEDAHTFGNHIHLRVKSARGPMERIPVRLQSANIPMSHLEPVPAT
jgi:ABC-2 type transport system ATP-binding protein